jgi:hypothetical protein
MKYNSSKFVGWLGAILAVAVVLAALTESASAYSYCPTDTTVLLLQKTPPQGGQINPKVGVHQFESNTEVILTAVPNPGYHFIYWLGDVSDPTANSTIAYIDGPKIIIAVFERAEYAFLTMIEMIKSTSGGGLFPSAADIGRGGGGGGGGGRGAAQPPAALPLPALPPPALPPPPEGDEVPVPEEQDEFPVPEEQDLFPVPGLEPIPEPATVVLLVLGSLPLFVKRRVRK